MKALRNGTLLLTGLSGSGIAFSQDSAPTSTRDLPGVEVHAAPKAADSLRVDDATVGPLGKLARVDTPYSINVVPQRLIANQQLKSIADALRYLPSVQGDGARPQSRGVQGSVVQNSRIDGLNAVSTTDYPLEQFDRIEVLNGPAGGLYGPANPAGSFNYVQLRPTDAAMERFTLGYSSGSRLLREADVSERVGKLGIRATWLDENGANYADGSKLRRQLASVALDYYLSPSTTIESNFSHYRFVSKGLPGTFALGAGVHFPEAPDPTRSVNGTRLGGNDNTTDTGSIKLRHAFNDEWQMTAGVLRQIADRESTNPTNTLINNAGTYRTTIGTATASRFTITSNMLALNGKVQAGSVDHALTIGTTGFAWNNYNPRAGGTVTLGTASLDDPHSFALVGVPDFTTRYQSARATQQSLNLADDITFSPRWSALLVGSQSWLATRNYNLAGAKTSSSDDKGASGAASLVFKPLWNMSTYLTYADSLQQGDTAPAGSTNAGAILAPFRSKQWELGYKAAWSGVNFSTAVFQIKRPFAYTQTDGTFGVAGEQRNRGLEVMLDGNVTDDLALFGGVSWLNARLYDTGTATTDGKRIVGLPRVTANMLFEYRLSAVPGLFAEFNARYVGGRPTDNANLTSVPSYTTFDLGLNYATTIDRHHIAFRVGVYNLADRRYWTNIVPGGLNGYTAAGNASASVGAPRTVQTSVQFDI